MSIPFWGGGKQLAIQWQVKTISFSWIEHSKLKQLFLTHSCFFDDSLNEACVVSVELLTWLMAFVSAMQWRIGSCSRWLRHRQIVILCCFGLLWSSSPNPEVLITMTLEPYSVNQVRFIAKITSSHAIWIKAVQNFVRSSYNLLILNSI
jgi:hypothetical protein